MLPQTFYAKSAFVKEQMQRKLEIGCDGIEYQLLPEDFSPHGEELLWRNKKREILAIEPASAVHPPLALAGAQIMLVPTQCAIMEESMRLAQISAEMLGHRTLVILHIFEPPSMTGRYELDAMGGELERLFKLFPDVDIVVENITPFRALRNGHPEFCNGYYDANVKFVEHFAYFGDRLKTCLDICHVLLSGKYLDSIAQVYGELPFKYDLRAYFEMNLPHLGLIHLASCEGNGYGKGHGTGFDVDDPASMAVLEEVLGLYEEYKLSCPITLEVREDNFYVSDIFEKSKQAVDHVFASRGLEKNWKH